MSKAKIAALILAVVVLNPGVVACGFTSQGTQEQKRPAEVQSTKEEAGEKTEEAEKGA